MAVIDALPDSMCKGLMMALAEREPQIVQRLIVDG